MVSSLICWYDVRVSLLLLVILGGRCVLGTLMLAHDAGKLVQEVLLLLTAVIAVEILSQMPVTGMNEFEHE